MKDNKPSDRIKVYVRIRPLNKRERTNDARCLEILCEKALVFAPPHLSENATKYRQKNARYQFDRIFGFSDDNEMVFKETTEELVKNCLKGFDSTVFAYGSTGSGKTHTMMGSADQRGIIPQAVDALFEQLAEHEDVKLMVSYLEIYNEEVFDLLVDGRKRVYVMEDKGAISVKGLSQHEIKAPDEYQALLELGGNNRSQSATDSNAQSSRSHAIFQIQITRKSFDKGVVSTLTSHINLVDLAGSERAAVAYKTSRSKTLTHEGRKINQSLLSLSNCLNKLATKEKHIPFRGSKLTLILRESFLGNGQTIMIAAASPSWNSYEETQNTLQYAQKAMGIMVSVRMNDATTYTAYHAANTNKIQELEEVIRRQQDEIRGLRETIDDMNKERRPGSLTTHTPLRAPEPMKPKIIYEDNFTISPSDLEPLDSLYAKKIELSNRRTNLELQNMKLCYEKSQDIWNRTLANLLTNANYGTDDYNKLPRQAYEIQGGIKSAIKELDDLQQQIDAEEKNLLERTQNSAEVRLHAKDNAIQFTERTSKHYEKAMFKFQNERLERAVRDSETLYETIQVTQKLYAVAAHSNILTDVLNNDYESVRDKILHGRKSVLFRDSLMTTPVRKRYDDLRTVFYMPLTTTPLSSKHTTIAMVKSVTPVSRHLREKLNGNNQHTEVKAQPKYVPARKVETAKTIALVNGAEKEQSRKRVLRIAGSQSTDAKRLKTSSQTNSQDLRKRTFAINPRWK